MGGDLCAYLRTNNLGDFAPDDIIDQDQGRDYWCYDVECDEDELLIIQLKFPIVRIVR